MMQVKITRTTIADGQVVRAGQVYDLTDADARLLLQLGKAVPAEPEQDPEPEPMTTASVEAVVEVETKKPRGRRK